MTNGNGPSGRVRATDGIGTTSSEARESVPHPINVTNLALNRRVPIGISPPPLRYARGWCIHNARGRGTRTHPKRPPVP